MLFQETLLHSPSKPLAHSPWCTSGGGHQLGMEKRSGSYVMWRGLTVIHYIFPVYRSLMKGFIAALSATKLESRFLNQQGLALVRIHISIKIIWTITVLLLCCWMLWFVWVLAMLCFVFIPTADPPQITTHPQGLKDVVPGHPVEFTIQAEGTEPLNYQWKQRPSGRSEGWQVCDGESFEGADSSTLTIPSVQKSNEGSYHCTVSNCANSETSDSVTLTLGELKYCIMHLRLSIHGMLTKVLQ